MARGTKITPKEEKLIRIAVHGGMEIADIAEVLGRSRQAIYKRLKSTTPQVHANKDQLPLYFGDPE